MRSAWARIVASGVLLTVAVWTLASCIDGSASPADGVAGSSAASGNVAGSSAAGSGAAGASAGQHQGGAAAVQGAAGGGAAGADAGPHPAGAAGTGVGAAGGNDEDPADPDWLLEPGPGRKVSLAGVNLPGAESGSDSLPGVYGVDYLYPDGESVEYYLGRGMNVFRIPFLWERMQPELEGGLDPEELARLAGLVEAITTVGATVILDPHNDARYAGQIVGIDIDGSALADFWSQLAAEFVDNESVVFGLMNEPHDMPSEVWVDVANLAIQAIRDSGATQLILVPGNGWTSAFGWCGDSYGNENGVAMRDITDPEDNFAFEVHQYLDQDRSGSGSTCVHEDSVRVWMEEFTEWAQWYGYRGFLGQFGVPATDSCLRALDALLHYVGEYSDVFVGWTYWAGGPLCDDHPMSVEPTSGEDRPQMLVLDRHLD